jgi:hypothetical protein
MRTGWCPRAERCRRRQGEGRALAHGREAESHRSAAGSRGAGEQEAAAGVRRAGQEEVVSDGPGRAFGTNGAGWAGRGWDALGLDWKGGRAGLQ